MRRPLFHSLAFSLAAAACSSATPPGAPDAASPPQRAEVIAEVPAVAAPAPPSLSHVVCAWGSTGVVASGAPIPYWTIGLVDVRASVEVTALALQGVTLFDASGRPIGTAERELELRAVPPDRSTRDYSSHGTTLFDGRVPAGSTLRLWMHGRLGDDFSPTPPAEPARYRATFRIDAGRTIEVEGPLDPQWPTG